jgi:uncharacterized lipoprotein YmbA
MFAPQKDVSRFYTLGSHSIVAMPPDETDVNLVVINLLLDEIPSYADCPYITKKVAGNKLVFSEVDRWAEPFGDACIRVLQDELSEKMRRCAMIVSSMHTIGNTLVCDYRISIDFDDLIYNDEEKSVVLKCTWTFFDYAKRRQLCVYKYAASTPVDTDALENIIEGMRIALAALSSDIADRIHELNLLPTCHHSAGIATDGKN